MSRRFDRRRGSWRFGLYAGGWTLIGLFFVSPIIARALADQAPVPWSEVLSTGYWSWGGYNGTVLGARAPIGLDFDLESQEDRSAAQE